MQVSVEKISNVERRLTIVVPAERISNAYKKQINEFAKKANLKGFRRGKAPISYVQERFGQDALKEALSDVIQASLHEAIATEKLLPISTPRIDTKNIGENQPLEFTASFEVLPEIGEINFKMDNAEKLNVDVKQEDVDHVLQQLQKQYTKWQQVDRPTQEKDRVVIDYYAIFEGKSDVENKITSFPLELGSKVMLPGFEDGLLGATVGEERTLKLTFPADFSQAERAGKPIDFVVTIKQILEADLPALNEDFVKKLGVKSGQMADLVEQIKQSLSFERDRLIKEKLKEQVFTQLLEQNSIEVPQSLIEQEAKQIHDEIYPQHQPHNHTEHSEQETQAFNEIAKKRVALGLLIAEYGRQKQLQPDQNRVQQRIQEIANVYENPQEVVTYLSTPERVRGIESQVMEDQVMEKLLEGVTITDKTMSYAELKGIRS